MRVAAASRRSRLGTYTSDDRDSAHRRRDRAIRKRETPGAYHRQAGAPIVGAVLAAPRLADRYPTALQLSAKDRHDVVTLHDRLIEQFAGKLEDAELDVPYTAQRLVHQIHERATVLAEEHHDTGTRLTIRAPSRVLSELRAALKPAP